jgi:hypothetical protein
MTNRGLLFVITVSAMGQNNLPLPAAGNVTLPLEEYTKLVELARQQPKKSEAPPLPYIVKNARMNLQVAGEAVSGTITLEGEVFAKGDRKVPLVTGMIVVDAQQQGRELAIEQEGGGHTALLPGPGEFAVTLRTGLPLSIEPGRASFNLPVPAAGATQLTLTVPGDQTQVNLSAGLITSRSSGQGRTVIEATLVPGETTNLWWASRLTSPPVAPKEVRFLSDIKTLISVSEAELSFAALAEITVVQGEPSQLVVHAPEGYELTGATGPTLASSDVQPNAIRLTLTDPAARSHQFLISMVKANITSRADDRPLSSANSTAEIPLVTFQGTQRETGEVLVEGDGTMELTATERGGLRRMDLKETSPYLRSLARAPLHVAFRYQKRPAETPVVALEWVRFPDSGVLSAVAQRAVVTTLVTTEGSSLTEVKLTLKNQSQPFLKVEFPAGASILSADVAGEKVKPVQGADGNRVPLLRPGFRPAGSYAISFVFLHAGAPFAKKGGGELSLPKMDIPIGILEWEVFLPERYKVADFGGDALSAQLLPAGNNEEIAEALPLRVTGFDRPGVANDVNLNSLRAGQVGGIVTDPSGALVSGANIAVVHVDTGLTQRTSADRSGRWMVSGIPSGRVSITVISPGFQMLRQEIQHDANRGTRRDVSIQVGSAAETVTITATAPLLNTESGELARVQRNARQNAAPADTAASSNVTDLQRRVVGVLPIAVNVPRTGNSYRFVRPVVVDEETKLTFTYRSK